MSSKGYSYAIDTLYADVGVGLGSLGAGSPFEEAGTASDEDTSTVPVIITPTVVEPTLGIGTLLDSKVCSNKGNQNGDDHTFGPGYVQINSKGDGFIEYGLTFQVQSSASDDNYVIVAIPGNTDLEGDCDQDCKGVAHSFVAFINKKQKSAIDNKVCEPKSNENGIADLLGTSTSIQETTLTATEYGQGNGGSYYFPDGTATASIIYKYKFVAKIEHKLYWSMHFVIKFMPGTPPENQWVRIYIPGSSGKVTGTIPATTEEATVPNTFYEQHTTSVYQPRVDGLIAWDSITFDLSENASVTVKVETVSMSSPYVFHATGPATQVKISIGQYDLPVDEGFEIWFTVAPIDNTKPATINNVKVFYWTDPTSP
ncbi:MAG TPA: hypothetical protein DCR68_06230 [Coprothermobacter sp.]|nr:hypothetical protein [Coprothermobacter sp.]